MVLAEMGLPYEFVVVDISKGEQKLPGFLAKQPFGVIPVLEDGPTTRLFESRAIARYLATKYASHGTGLLGKDAAARAQTDLWWEVESQNFNGPASTLAWETVFKGKPANRRVVAVQLAGLNKVLDVYEGILATRPYLAGLTFSMADLSHLPYGSLLHEAGFSEPFDRRPHVKAWWARLVGRAAWTHPPVPGHNLTRKTLPSGRGNQ